MASTRTQKIKPGQSMDGVTVRIEESPNADLIREMVQTTLKLSRDATDRGDLKVLNKALKELRQAFRVFAPYRHLRKVAVFGSARTSEGSEVYRQAVYLGKCLGDRGFMVITGAGAGIMKAVNEGAGREKSFGVNIRLPFEQETNPVVKGDPKLATFRYFFARKLMFVKESHAVVAFPGGFGTMDEVFEVLTLMQTGKCPPMPLVLVDTPGGTYWSAWDRFLRESLLPRGLVSPQDPHFYRITDSIEVACEEIGAFYSMFHSMRQVGRHTVFRLNRPANDGLLGALGDEFRDILDGEPLRQVPHALPQELDDPDIRDLPRLLVPFNNRDMGRLRQLIDRLNQGSGPLH
jgi:hypothetical protein